MPLCGFRVYELAASCRRTQGMMQDSFGTGPTFTSPMFEQTTAGIPVCRRTGRQVVAGPPVWNCGTEDANEQIVISHISFTEPGQNQPGKPAYQYVTHTRT